MTHMWKLFLIDTLLAVIASVNFGLWQDDINAGGFMFSLLVLIAGKLNDH